MRCLRLRALCQECWKGFSEADRIVPPLQTSTPRLNVACTIGGRDMRPKEVDQTMVGGDPLPASSPQPKEDQTAELGHLP